MKSLTKILLIVLMGVFVMTGCGLTKEENNEVLVPQELNADNILDKQIYERAINMQDSKICDTISEKSIKEECINVANALGLMDQAVAKLDKKICSQIKLNRYEEECKSRIASILAQQKAEQEQQEKRAKQEEERQKIEQKAVDTGDYKLCDKIEDENQKASCKYNTLVSKAINENKPELCDKIGKKEFIDLCMSNVSSRVQD